jgi:hypothetical protein
VIAEGRGVSLAIISRSVTKVKYTLFLFSRSTCVILLSIARVCLCAASQCPYFVECFVARLQQPRQTVLIPQHEGTPMKQKLIRATELAEFVYCSKAWHLKYVEGAEVSPVARELQAEANAWHIEQGSLALLIPR